MKKAIKKSIDQILNANVVTLNPNQKNEIKGGDDTIGIQDIVDGYQS